MKYYRILSNLIITYEKNVFHNEECTYIFLKHSTNKLGQKA